MVSSALGDYVVLDVDQVCRVSKVDGGNAAFQVVGDGRRIWRPLNSAVPLFGSSGVPKASPLVVGDVARLPADDAVEPGAACQLVKAGESGQVCVRLLADGGKTLWRPLPNLLPPDDDAPKLSQLIGALPLYPAPSGAARTVLTPSQGINLGTPSKPDRPAATDSMASRLAQQRQLRSQQRAAKAGLVTASLGGGGEPCSMCGKTCYAAERAASTPAGKVIHRACFTCRNCGKPLLSDWHLAPLADGSEGYFCEAHAQQQRGIFSPVKDTALAMAAVVATGDDPLCSLCGIPVARGDRWDIHSNGMAAVMAAHPRWGGDAVLHLSCGGCFKCGGKSGLELDGIGGIYCAAHMKQRIAAAGGAMRAHEDLGALERTEPMFLRDLRSNLTRV
jgi:hypothetical protein